MTANREPDGGPLAGPVSRFCETMPARVERALRGDQPPAPARRDRHFVAYGGPEGGSIVRLPKGRTEHVWQEPFGGRVVGYVLASTRDGGSALVPKDDCHLWEAFLRAPSDRYDRERQTLADELKRRGLGRP